MAKRSTDRQAMTRIHIVRTLRPEIEAMAKQEISNMDEIAEAIRGLAAHIDSVASTTE